MTVACVCAYMWLTSFSYHHLSWVSVNYMVSTTFVLIWHSINKICWLSLNRSPAERDKSVLCSDYSSLKSDTYTSQWTTFSHWDTHRPTIPSHQPPCQLTNVKETPANTQTGLISTEMKLSNTSYTNVTVGLCPSARNIYAVWCGELLAWCWRTAELIYMDLVLIQIHSPNFPLSHVTFLFYTFTLHEKNENDNLIT